MCGWFRSPPSDLNEWMACLPEEILGWMDVLAVEAGWFRYQMIWPVFAAEESRLFLADGVVCCILFPYA